MLKASLVVVFVGTGLVASLLAAGGAQPKESEGFSFYLKYLKASASARTIGDVAPFMPSWWRARYESGDEAARTAALERIRSRSQGLLDVKLVREEAVKDGVRLHMTAKEKNDFSMRGNVLLIRESKAFTVEEEAWATAPEALMQGFRSP